ncbi:MAG: glycosyltransferase [Chloroflexi bacterium]|nr:glycosyltransferase [Chloroflexota bacterium]
MRERMTVLFPITDLAMDGAQRQLLELVKGLDKERFTPIVLTIRPGGSQEQEFKEVPGLQVISLDQKHKYDFSCLFKVSDVIRRMKVDVVQPFLTPATFFGLLPALWCGTPVKIATERLASGRRTGVRFGFRFYLVVEDLLSRSADWVIANSEAGKEYLIHRGISPRRARVIYNGLNLSRLSARKEAVDEVRRRLGVSSEGKVVGMMARLFPQKRHAVFLQAAAIVTRWFPETKFALVGDGPLRSNLESLAQELGLSRNVVFLGEQREVGPYVSAFDIAVMTSETEGCSNSILEAMALGKPVVATDVGGNRELINNGETGVLVTPGDAEAVASAIGVLLRDQQATEAMGRRARECVVRRFSVESMVSQYQALYEESLDHKKIEVKSEARNPRLRRKGYGRQAKY